MKYDPAFIEAIKEWVRSERNVFNSFFGAKIEIDGEEKSIKELKLIRAEAEAHLDSFGEEE